MKIFQLIRGQGGHIGFRIYLINNNTCLLPHKEIFDNLAADPCNRTWEEVKNVSANQRPEWPYWISDPLKK